MRSSVVEFNRADRMSKMHCGVRYLLILWTIVHLAAAEIDLGVNQEQCVPGTTWKDDCNSCFCTAGGLAACTLVGCYGPRINIQSILKCVPNTVWKEECNTCVCTPNGTAACTRMACPKRKKASPSENCVPGTMWFEGCKKCVCIRPGGAACTSMACPPGLDYSPAAMINARPPSPAASIVKGWK